MHRFLSLVVFVPSLAVAAPLAPVTDEGAILVDIEMNGATPWVAYSEAGTMQATRTLGSPISLARVSSVSMASFPQRWEASFISMPASVTMRYDGLGAIPEMKSASQPANLSSGPKNPPELASPQPPVSGDLQTTT